MKINFLSVLKAYPELAFFSSYCQ